MKPSKYSDTFLLNHLPANALNKDDAINAWAKNLAGKGKKQRNWCVYLRQCLHQRADLSNQFNRLICTAIFPFNSMCKICRFIAKSRSEDSFHRYLFD